MNILLLLLAGLQMVLASAGFNDYRRVCYYVRQSAGGEVGKAAFTPEDIDPYLCSHIVYAYGTVRNNRLDAASITDTNGTTGRQLGLYERFNRLKLTSPNVKTLLAVGGWNMKSYKLTSMLSSASTRAEFVHSARAFLRRHNFDGLDLHFMYPGSRASPKVDVRRFSLLCRELSERFLADSVTTGRDRLLLAVTVPAEKKYIDRGYEVKVISRYADFINLLSFDLHGGWEKKTGHQSPLFGTRSDRYLSMAWAARYWVRLGAPKSKLVIGMSTYGRGFTLARPVQNGLGSPAVGPSLPGRYTRQGGVLAYYEICQNLQHGFHKVWLSGRHVPYITAGNQWVGYDDTASLTDKVRWLKTEGYSGWMAASLDMDDFRGIFCGQGRYPLLTTMNRALRNVIGPGEIIQVPSTTTTPAPSLPDNIIETFCTERMDGHYPYPRDCRRYLTCIWGEATVHRCPDGLAFDIETNDCNARTAVYAC